MSCVKHYDCAEQTVGADSTTQATGGGTESQPEPNEFVSAVCWKNGSNILLAANSQGHIKVSCGSAYCTLPQ